MADYKEMYYAMVRASEDAISSTEPESSEADQ